MEITSNAPPPPRKRSRQVAENEGENMTEGTVPVSRPDMRAPMRQDTGVEDSRARAARRAAEIRGHIGNEDQGSDEFYVDLDIVPDGWTYEWKRLSILGQEDATHQIHLARMGWEPVPVSRHPQMMPASWTKGTIERKGMILMERPTEIVERARLLNKKAAKDQVRAKEAQIAGTPDGTLTRDHEQARPRIKKDYSPIPVPRDDAR